MHLKYLCNNKYHMNICIKIGISILMTLASQEQTFWKGKKPLASPPKLIDICLLNSLFLKVCTPISTLNSFQLWYTGTFFHLLSSVLPTQTKSNQ